MMKNKLKLRTLDYCYSIILFQVFIILYYAFNITYQNTMLKDEDYDYLITFNVTLVLFSNTLLRDGNPDKWHKTLCCLFSNF